MIRKLTGALSPGPGSHQVQMELKPWTFHKPGQSVDNEQDNTEPSTALCLLCQGKHKQLVRDAWRQGCWLRGKVRKWLVLLDSPTFFWMPWGSEQALNLLLPNSEVSNRVQFYPPKGYLAMSGDTLLLSQLREKLHCWHQMRGDFLQCTGHAVFSALSKELHKSRCQQCWGRGLSVLGDIGWLPGLARLPLDAGAPL